MAATFGYDQRWIDTARQIVHAMLLLAGLILTFMDVTGIYQKKSSEPSE